MKEDKRKGAVRETSTSESGSLPLPGAASIGTVTGSSSTSQRHGEEEGSWEASVMQPISGVEGDGDPGGKVPAYPSLPQLA